MGGGAQVGGGRVAFWDSISRERNKSRGRGSPHPTPRRRPPSLPRSHPCLARAFWAVPLEIPGSAFGPHTHNILRGPPSPPLCASLVCRRAPRPARSPAGPGRNLSLEGLGASRVCFHVPRVPLA